mmetsp:Transcript_10866/g.35996  ORF Transcript_10866/g.35996 Transcript_10866/m.35996 type:complete len:98 (+) Transcript_10866:850-1143(+)
MFRRWSKVHSSWFPKCSGPTLQQPHRRLWRRYSISQRDSVIIPQRPHALFASMIYDEQTVRECARWTGAQGPQHVPSTVSAVSGSRRAAYRAALKFK